MKAGETDLQTPHNEDELYYVVAGRAMIRVADEERKVGPGTLIFVPSRVSHRFHNVDADLVVLGLFRARRDLTRLKGMRRGFGAVNGCAASVLELLFAGL